jgi:hypothetical protein
MNRNIAIHTQSIHSTRAISHRIVARRRRVLSRTVATASERERVVTAFRALAHGVDCATAAARTNAFYRSGGMDWARCLS